MWQEIFQNIFTKLIDSVGMRPIIAIPFCIKG